MAGRLEGKVCIVTGGGSRSEGIGNGRAAAILFAREGGRVLVQGRTPGGPELTKRMIQDEGGVAEVFVGDVNVEDGARAMVGRAMELWGRLDVLDNNIGIGGPGTILQATEELWDEVMAVNVKTMVFCSKHAIPAMVESGGGSIINISSIGALRPRGLTPYSTSKGAVIALSRAMAVDHAAQGIRVNCLAVGPVYTPMATRDGMSEERREQRRLASPLAREGTGWDTGHAAVFFASDESRYITGAVLSVDGGSTLVGPSR